MVSLCSWTCCQTEPYLLDLDVPLFFQLSLFFSVNNMVIIAVGFALNVTFMNNVKRYLANNVYLESFGQSFL